MKNYLKMFQEGGPMGAPAGGANPDEMLATIVKTQDAALALEFCNMLAQQMGLSPEGGAPAGPGGTPPPPAGPEGAPAPPPMGRYGMKVPKIQL